MRKIEWQFVLFEKDIHRIPRGLYRITDEPHVDVYRLENDETGFITYATSKEILEYGQEY